MKIAPSTPTLSIAATISSPVTWGGQFGTLCQGRLGVFASYAWTCESMMGMVVVIYRRHVPRRASDSQGTGSDPLRHGPVCARRAAGGLERQGHRFHHGAAPDPGPPRPLSQSPAAAGRAGDAGHGRAAR